jgi:glycosyltransferase involved in cell wall biosynthesis
MFGHGDPELIEELRQYPDITVHNSVSPAELREFASQHRCCGLVLYNEHPRYRLIGTNSRKLYEYLAMGLPVISTSVGELPDFIIRNQVGIVIDARIDTEELSSAMQRLAQTDSAWQEWSTNARLLMSKPEMSWEYEWNRVRDAGVLGQSRRAA